MNQSFDIRIKASTECTLKVDEHEIKILPADSILHTVAPAVANVVTQKLLGFEVKELKSMIATNLSKLSIVEKGQNVKLFPESKNKSGKNCFSN